MAAETPQTKPAPRRRDASAPSRSVEEISRDIASERAALDRAFADLQRDVQQTVGQVRRQVISAGRKALVIGPAVGVAGGLVAGIVLLGRRHRDKED